jgi:hypothetical protein
VVAFPLLLYRVVTLSFSPYIVVHVNTAYTRLTGYSSAKVLGKPLHDCLGANCKDWIKGCTSPHPIAALHDRVSTIRAKEKTKWSTSCRMHATLVGPQIEGKKEPDTSSVTHYSVSFLPLLTSTETTSCDSRQQMPATGSSVCKKAKVAVSVTRSEESVPDARFVMG